jgi:hypothetical protein
MSGLKLKAKSRRSRTKNTKPAIKKKSGTANVTPQDFLAAVNNKIEHEFVARYLWEAYGPVAYFIDAKLPVELGSAQMIIDLSQNQICEMHACDYREVKTQQAWRWINPRYRTVHAAEAKRRCDHDFAWDSVRWVHVPPARILSRIKKLVAAASQKKTRRGKP